MCKATCLCVCLYVCMSVCLSVCLFVCLSICLFVCLFVCLSVCLSVCLFVCLPMCILQGDPWGSSGGHGGSGVEPFQWGGGRKNSKRLHRKLQSWNYFVFYVIVKILFICTPIEMFIHRKYIYLYSIANNSNIIVTLLSIHSRRFN